jgi:hypothetical protein
MLLAGIQQRDSPTVSLAARQKRSGMTVARTKAQNVPVRSIERASIRIMIDQGVFEDCHVLARIWRAFGG